MEIAVEEHLTCRRFRLRHELRQAAPRAGFDDQAGTRTRVGSNQSWNAGRAGAAAAWSRGEWLDEPDRVEAVDDGGAAQVGHHESGQAGDGARGVVGDRLGHQGSEDGARRVEHPDLVLDQAGPVGACGRVGVAAEDEPPAVRLDERELGGDAEAQGADEAKRGAEDILQPDGGPGVQEVRHALVVTTSPRRLKVLQ